MIADELNQDNSVTHDMPIPAIGFAVMKNSVNTCSDIHLTKPTEQKKR